MRTMNLCEYQARAPVSVRVCVRVRVRVRVKAPDILWKSDLRNRGMATGEGEGGGRCTFESDNFFSSVTTTGPYIPLPSPPG